MRVSFYPVGNPGSSIGFDCVSPFGAGSLTITTNDSIHGQYRELQESGGRKVSGTVEFWICKRETTFDDDLTAAYECAEDILSGSFSMAFDDGTPFDRCVMTSEFAPERISQWVVTVRIEVSAWY